MILDEFCQSWKNGVVQVGKVKFTMSAKAIILLTGLSIQGKTFQKKPKSNYKEYFKMFLGQGYNVVRHLRSFKIDDFPSIWKEVVRLLMKFFTLEGCFKRFHSQLFTIFNHLRHGIRMNFPFWIYTSLSQSIEVANSKGSLLLHDG